MGDWLTENRAQTLQDFTVGIVVFLLTTTAVLTSLAGYVTPFWSDAGTEELSKSERIAETLAQSYATEDSPTELNAEQLWNDVFSKSESQLRTQWGLRESTLFRVAIVQIDPNGPNPTASYNGNALAVGAKTTGETATVRRTITLSDSGCKVSGVQRPVNTCELVVRVW